MDGRPAHEDSVRAGSILWRLETAALNVLFWCLFTLWTALLVIVALPYYYLFSFLTRNPRRSGRLLRQTISHYGSLVIHSGWPFVRIKYVDLAPDEQPPFVFVANHRSTSDAFLMSVLSRECVQVLNIWTSRLYIVNRLSRLAGYLRVRELTHEQFMEQGLKLLEEGVSVIAFPEGTRSGSRNMGPFHGAIFRVAQKAGAKVCPVAISGSEEIPHKGSLVIHPGRITITKLPSLTAQQYQGLNAYQLKMRARNILEKYLDPRPQQEARPQLDPQPA
jgi:1-acyl-sn-glycerol-3-phosphate acyltransferase